MTLCVLAAFMAVMAWICLKVPRSTGQELDVHACSPATADGSERFTMLHKQVLD